MTRNLGQSSLRRKRRAQDPMDAFDCLPAPARQWMAQAALPWSPTSVRRIWTKSRARGLSPQETVTALHQVEAKTLARDKHATASKLKSMT